MSNFQHEAHNTVASNKEVTIKANHTGRSKGFDPESLAKSTVKQKYRPIVKATMIAAGVITPNAQFESAEIAEKWLLDEAVEYHATIARERDEAAE